MLTGLRVGNFKAFAETQRVPVRPLTFIYGANSAGKSSLIHSLLLARHALDTGGDFDAQRTSVGGDSVDLGGFRQYVHRRDLARQLEWSVELDTGHFKDWAGSILSAVPRIALSLRVGVRGDAADRPTADPRPVIQTFEIDAQGAPLLRMSRRPENLLQLDMLDPEHPTLRRFFQTIIETGTTTSRVEPEDLAALREAVAEVVPEIRAPLVGLFPTEIVKPEAAAGDQRQLPLFPVSRGDRKEDLAAAVRFYLPRNLEHLLRALGEAVEDCLGRLSYLGPLRSYPPRHLAFSPHHDPNWYAGGGYAWDVVRKDAEVRAAVNGWLSSPDRLKTPYQLELLDFLNVDQLDVPLEEGLQRVVEEDLEIGYEPEGEHNLGGPVPGLKDPEKSARRLVKGLRSADVDKLQDLILLDLRSKPPVPVSHRDVGIGVSQVLPVLVGAYASRNRLVAIEQPEIHLHPALQADLGDLFIESALGERKNTFLIETHSENVLLRVMRAMRDTARGKRAKLPPVRPEDVAVLFVQRQGPRSIVLEIRLDEEGNLLDPWPGGFFEEGFQERFGAPEPTPKPRR